MVDRRWDWTKDFLGYKLVVMTEQKQIPWPKNEVEAQTYEDLLKQYRVYVNDPKAEFPPEILEELKKQGKIK